MGVSSEAAMENSQRLGEGPCEYPTTVTQGMGEGPMTCLENMFIKMKDYNFFLGLNTVRCALQRAFIHTKPILGFVVTCYRRSERSHIFSLCAQLCCALMLWGARHRRESSGEEIQLGWGGGQATAASPPWSALDDLETTEAQCF